MPSLTNLFDGPTYVPGILTEVEGSGSVIFSKAGITGTRIFRVPWSVKITDPFTNADRHVSYLDYVQWLLGRPYYDAIGLLHYVAPDVFSNELNYLVCQEVDVKGEITRGREGDSGDSADPTIRPVVPVPNAGGIPGTAPIGHNPANDFGAPPPGSPLGAATPNDPPSPWTNNPDPNPNTYPQIGRYQLPEPPTPGGKLTFPAGGTGPLGSVHPVGIPEQLSPRIVYKHAILTAKYSPLTADERLSLSARSQKRRGQGYAWTQHADDSSNTAPPNLGANLAAGQWPAVASDTLGGDQPIGFPSLQGDFSLNKRQVPAAELFNNIMPLLGTCNADTFRGLAAQTVLFAGSEGKRMMMPNGAPVWDLHLKFLWNRFGWNRIYHQLRGFTFVKSIGDPANPITQNKYVYDTNDFSVFDFYR